MDSVGFEPTAFSSLVSYNCKGDVLPIELSARNAESRTLTLRGLNDTTRLAI